MVITSLSLFIIPIIAESQAEIYIKRVYSALQLKFVSTYGNE